MYAKCTTKYPYCIVMFGEDLVKILSVWKWYTHYLFYVNAYIVTIYSIGARGFEPLTSTV